MTEQLLYVTIASASLAAIGMLAVAALSGWRGWLDLKRLELQATRPDGAAPPTAGSRIEIADLKERIRKLEAIAAGVDL